MHITFRRKFRWERKEKAKPWSRSVDSTLEHYAMLLRPEGQESIQNGKLQLEGSKLRATAGELPFLAIL